MEKGIVCVLVLVGLSACGGHDLTMSQTIPFAERANLSEPQEVFPEGPEFTLFEGPLSLPSTAFRYVKLRRQDGLLHGAWVEPGFNKKVGEVVRLWHATVYYAQGTTQQQYGGFYFAR